MKKVLFILIASVAVITASASSDTASVSLQVGSATKSAAITLTDSTTGAAITNATITNVVVQNNNPEIANVVLAYTGASSVNATAVSGGTGTALVTCNVSYTDIGDGLKKNQTKSVIITYTVVQLTPHGATLNLSFN